jgi:lysophospholipase L1-like esterase
MRPVDPQTGRLAVYRRKWFGKIMERYRGTATRVVFYRLPRAPIPRPDSLVTKLSSSIREFQSGPNVLLLDEHTFDSLERPEFFQDALHLNREGAARFSKLMAERLPEALASPPGANL